MTHIGHKHIEGIMPGVQMSEFGKQVADLLGQLFLGLYHLDNKTLRKVDWSDTLYIEVLLNTRQLSTYDDSTLTMLVLLCHDRIIRGSIGAARNGILRLSFTPRHRHEGSTSTRHPTLEEHITRLRIHLGESK